MTIMWPQIFAFCVLHDDHGDCDEDDHLVVSDICMREFNRNVSLIDEGLVKSPLQKNMISVLLIVMITSRLTTIGLEEEWFFIRMIDATEGF